MTPKMRETSDEDDDPEYDGLSSLSASEYERDDDAGEITPAVEEDGDFNANGAIKVSISYYKPGQSLKSDYKTVTT